MEPRQWVSSLLTKLAIGAMLGKKPHVFEVAGRPAAHVRKGIFQVARQPVNHLGTPALGALPLQDVAPDEPIQLHQLGIDGQRRALPGISNLALELGQPVGIAFRWKQRGFAGRVMR